MLPALLLALLQTTPLQTGPALPPGLVPIAGGRARLGLGADELERMLAKDETLRPFAGALSAETPPCEVEVAPFLLMPTEVTALQYALYLRATGRRAPRSWCDTALRAASEAHARSTEELAADARARGSEPPPVEPFDADRWWSANGASATWEIPAGLAAAPVVHVGHGDARAYARWAGLRLPSEAELARAARGDTRRSWPWGEDVRVEKLAATLEGARRGLPANVASFPAGATREGVYDLAGNVWEWTSSAYTAYPGYEPREWVFGAGAKAQRVTAIAAFDATQRVACGGSFQNRRELCRSSVRLGLDPEQRTDALGFRCAASPAPGFDLARAAIEDELSRARAPIVGGPLPAFAPELAVALSAWQTSELAPIEGWTPPPGFAAISGHSAIAFVPVARLPVRDPQSFEKLADAEAPVVLGFLHTTLPLRRPELPPGTWIVAWKAGAIAYDVDGKEAARFDATLAWNLERAGSATVTTVDGSSAPHLQVWIPSETSRRGYVLDFELATAEPWPGLDPR